MTSITDFNRIDDCDKISADCINAEIRWEQTDDTTVCLYTSWGDYCIDFTEIVKNAETCTTLYLSPEENPNCLVYEPECGDNICITGDELSRIISLTKLKDVDQTTAPTNGDVYIYDSTTNKFKTFNLTSVLGNIGTDITNINAAISNLRNRVITLENKLTPPADAPVDAGVVFGNINLYSDPNVVINEGTGIATTLDKTHGLYTHLLSESKYADEIFG